MVVGEPLARSLSYPDWRLLVTAERHALAHGAIIAALVGTRAGRERTGPRFARSAVKRRGGEPLAGARRFPAEAGAHAEVPGALMVSAELEE